MQTQRLGKTDLQVSELCFGAMKIAHQPQAAQLLSTFVDAGGTFIDTANIYAHWLPDGAAGDSETFLGNWLSRNRLRDELVLATKVGFGCKPAQEQPGIPQGLRPDWIRAQCDASLKRLRTPHIDLYYAHFDDRDTPLEEWLPVFESLRQAGKIRAYGVSNFAAWRMALAADRAAHGLCAHQARYSYLEPRNRRDYRLWPPARDEHEEAEAACELTRVAYSPLLGGAYQRQDRPLPKPYQTQENQRRMEVLHAVAARHSATPVQVVLAWMRQRGKRPVIPLFSASTVEQLSEDLAACQLRLSEDDQRRLDSAG